MLDLDVSQGHCLVMNVWGPHGLPIIYLTFEGGSSTAVGESW